MSRPLNQQAVIVTGAAQGLGAAIARRFAREGARLVIMDYNGVGLAQVAAQCGPNTTPVTVDLSDFEATETAIARALQVLGPVDTLVHNAAILVETPFADETAASFTRSVNVALQAGFQLAHAVWPAMMARGHGALIFVSSRSGIEGFANETAYCAGKHALEGLSKSLALEGVPHGIHANTVTPGMYMRTPMSERTYSAALKQQWVEPERLTSAFVALAEADPTLANGARIDAWLVSQDRDGQA